MNCDALPGSDARDALLIAAVESTADAVVTVDPEGSVTSWNRGAETLFGYSADEAAGHSLSAIIIPPGSHAEWQARRELFVCCATSGRSASL